MTEYLLIESHNPMESTAAVQHLELAAALARRGHPVAVFLVQNGVMPARENARATVLDRLADDGVSILADDFSLRERGIDTDSLRARVTPVSVETVVDHLVRGARTIWH